MSASITSPIGPLSPNPNSEFAGSHRRSSAPSVLHNPTTSNILVSSSSTSLTSSSSNSNDNPKLIVRFHNRRSSAPSIKDRVTKPSVPTSSSNKNTKDIVRFHNRRSSAPLINSVTQSGVAASSSGSSSQLARNRRVQSMTSPPSGFPSIKIESTPNDDHYSITDHYYYNPYLKKTRAPLNPVLLHIDPTDEKAKSKERKLSKNRDKTRLCYEYMQKAEKLIKSDKIKDYQDAIISYRWVITNQNNKAPWVKPYFELVKLLLVTTNHKNEEIMELLDSVINGRFSDEEKAKAYDKKGDIFEKREESAKAESCKKQAQILREKAKKEMLVNNEVVEF